MQFMCYSPKTRINFRKFSKLKQNKLEKQIYISTISVYVKYYIHAICSSVVI